MRIDLKRGDIYQTPFMLLKYQSRNKEGNYRFYRLDIKGTLMLSKETVDLFMKRGSIHLADSDVVAKLLLAEK